MQDDLISRAERAIKLARKYESRADIGGGIVLSFCDLVSAGNRYPDRLEAPFWELAKAVEAHDPKAARLREWSAQVNSAELVFLERWRDWSSAGRPKR